MFRELCKRRNIGIKYERYAAALAAAAIYNVHRASAEDPVVTAVDFVRTPEQAERREKVLKARQYVNRALGGLPIATPREKYLEIRGKVIADLLASGYQNAEDIVNEMFSSLIPKDGEN